MREETIHPNDCGNCKHWHPLEVQGHTITEGECDKIKRGTLVVYTNYDNVESSYRFDGFAFADECYDEDLHCFEEAT